MERKVEIITKQEMKIEEYWVIRGIVTDSKDRKTVVVEAELGEPPTLADIADFLHKNPYVEFCSVKHNFRKGGDK